MSTAYSYNRRRKIPALAGTHRHTELTHKSPPHSWFIVQIFVWSRVVCLKTHRSINLSIANNRQTDDQTTAKKQATVAPFDRLPPVGEKRIPGNSPYHTARAQDARNNALNYLSVEEVHSAQETLIEAGNKRWHEDIADVADHNALTLAAALRYADLGLHVVDSHGIKNSGGQTLPSPDGCKTPRGARWQERATTDSETIVKFWTGNGVHAVNSKGEQYSYAKVNAPRNVSIVFPENGDVFALDIDGRKGQAELARLELEHGALPKTLKSLSGSGEGFHMLFRTSERIRNTTSAIAPGVDIRGEGGQIIAPPSVHPTFGFYAWEEGLAPGQVEIADAPDWLVKVALESSKVGRRVRPDGQAASEIHTPREPTGDSSGFEMILATIGDDAEGFDKPIYRAACSWFSAHGTDADASILQDEMVTSILDAFCKDDRNVDRYATDTYLDDRIEQARAFIADADDHVDYEPSGDAEQPHAQGTASAVSYEDLETRCGTFNKKSNAKEIEEFLLELCLEDIDVTDRARATDLLIASTVLGKRDINKMWTEIDRVQAKIATAGDKTDGGTDAVSIMEEWDFRKKCSLAQSRLDEANANATFLFDRMDDLCTIRHRDGHTSLKLIKSQRAFDRHLNDHVTFSKKAGQDGGRKGTSAESDVAAHLFEIDKTHYPALEGTTSTPFFSKSGELVTTCGYHHESRTYLETGDAVFADVSRTPTLEEAKAAIQMLMIELADFPIGGMSRKQIEEQFWKGDGVPSMVHTLSDLLLPFMREVIKGPTPGHVFNKPAPGTGATLLCDVLSIISTGDTVSPIIPPKDIAELEKTLGAALQEGPQKVFFDNINNKMDSGALASAMTSDSYSARILGKTELINTRVKNVWEFTANKLEMTWELLRRCILIDLNARMDDPTERDVNLNRRPEIAAYVREHRTQLVHACLTIIQYWVSQGMPDQNKHTLASYEVWSRKMGGLWSACEVPGFLGNEAQKKGDLGDSKRDEVREFIGALAQYALDHTKQDADGRYKVYARSGAHLRNCAPLQ